MPPLGKVALKLCLMTVLVFSFRALPVAFGEPEDREPLPTYDQLSPEELAQTMPKPEKIEDKLRMELDELRRQMMPFLKRLNQIGPELQRLDRIERTGTKQLFDDFTKKKIPYSDYDTGASPGKLQKEREALTAEKNSLHLKAVALLEKERLLERELADYVQIRKPDPMPYTSPTGERGLKKVLQQRIAEFNKELSVEEDYLRQATIWEKDYPESRSSLAAQQRRVDEVKAQLRDAEEGLRLLERKKDVAPGAGAEDQVNPPASSPERPRKPLTAEEKSVWKKKGFSDIEIKTLYNGGMVTDETGHMITGWPPSSAKRKLSLSDRLKKTLQSSK